jgi:hypothetical protein
MQLNAACPQAVPLENAGGVSKAPAADYFGEKKADGKVERRSVAFAKTLEKIQTSVEVGSACCGRSRGTGQADAKEEEKTQTFPAETGDKLRELLSGLNEQQLIRVLMMINPQELLQTLESLGFDPATLPEPQALTDARAHPTAEGKSGLNRGRLIDALIRLSALVGEQTVLDAIAATLGSKRPANSPSSAGEAAGQGKSREIGDVRNIGKKPRVVVLDLRKDQAAPKTGEDQPSSMKSAFTATMKKGLESHQERDVSLLFRTPIEDRAQKPVLEASASASRTTPSFERRFIPEVVKQTGIILKDGGNGEIRLVLKPENLGSIRIRLALSESSLEGRIVVDNNNVKELVESSLDNLKNALRLEGYQTNLEVSVGHRRNWHGNEQVQTQPTGWLAGGGSEEFDKSIPLYLEMRPDYELVNMFA